MIFSPYENLGIWDLKKYGLRSVALNTLAINVLGGAFFKKNTLLARNQQACHQCVWRSRPQQACHQCAWRRPQYGFWVDVCVCVLFLFMSLGLINVCGSPCVC